ncbi:hypothetical protein AVEN_155453-1 [Araneus ventricosus]|uniref:Uncharacterized protein n=1 Tax=Araneus ventricosus TaxID=182803 RepID=A0A4Y2NE85_ARAVE|nr:hypothetical protein AVEN_155453-1 [Araneus ventricosus]
MRPIALISSYQPSYKGVTSIACRIWMRLPSSLTRQDHMNNLDEILGKIASDKLKIKPVKCKFAQDCDIKVTWWEGDVRRRQKQTIKRFWIFLRPVPKLK